MEEVDKMTDLWIIFLISFITFLVGYFVVGPRLPPMT